MDRIEQLIPHRKPFLLIDEIVELTDAKIRTRYTVRRDDPLFALVFQGHYPGNPIIPGALLCEMVFQAGAVLLSRRAGGTDGKVPVLVRVKDARFKQMARPGDLLDIEAEFVDQVSNAYYMKGAAGTGGETAVRVDFTCALVPRPEVS